MHEKKIKNRVSSGAVAKATGYSQRHLRRLVSEGRFPLPQKMSDYFLSWDRAEIEEWILDHGVSPRKRRADRERTAQVRGAFSVLASRR
jgi:predicted DNA-binding transcriptional regulator AlpA